LFLEIDFTIKMEKEAVFIKLNFAMKENGVAKNTSALIRARNASTRTMTEAGRTRDTKQ